MNPNLLTVVEAVADRLESDNEVVVETFELTLDALLKLQARMAELQAQHNELRAELEEMKK